MPRVRIPQIIMQTYKTETLPAKWQSSQDSIKKYMPNWRYILMTDEMNRKFVEENFRSFLPVYDAFPYPIQRADAIRYMWLYMNGGLYMDCDIELLAPLDSLFYQDSELYLVQSGNVGSVITNSMMASKPYCRIWLDAVEAMRQPPPWYCIGRHLTVMNTTGPLMINYVVKKGNIPYIALPPKLVMPCSICDQSTCNCDNALVRPLQGSSWVTWDTHCYNFFLCNWRAVVILIAVIAIAIIFWFWIIPAILARRQCYISS